MPQSFIKFYGNDWRSDPRLRLCSAAARGVWIDIISFMMEAEPFGHLLINGRAPSVDVIAALTVTPAKIVSAALEELEENGVFSVTEAGVIYSRRMVKDAVRTAELTERGRRGGNPSLLNHRDKPEVNHKDKPPVKPEDKPKDKLAGATRSQKPEARESSNGKNGSVDTPEDFLYAFEAIREEQFGGPPASATNGSAKSGSYSPKEISIAKGWIEQGIPFYPFRNLLEKQMATMARKRAPPPTSVWFFHKSVDDAVASNWAGYDE